MIFLSLRSDNPMAEAALYDNEHEKQTITWEAHRMLAETLHQKIETLLKENDVKWENIEGVVLYAGPGSFTGLRIGFSVGNAIAYANKVQIVAETGDDWQMRGVTRLMGCQGDVVALPEYGGPAHTTTQLK